MWLPRPYPAPCTVRDLCRGITLTSSETLTQAGSPVPSSDATSAPDQPFAQADHRSDNTTNHAITCSEAVSTAQRGHVRGRGGSSPPSGTARDAVRGWSAICHSSSERHAQRAAAVPGSRQHGRPGPQGAQAELGLPSGLASHPFIEGLCLPARTQPADAASTPHRRRRTTGRLDAARRKQGRGAAGQSYAATSSYQSSYHLMHPLHACPRLGQFRRRCFTGSPSPAIDALRSNARPATSCCWPAGGEPLPGAAA